MTRFAIEPDRSYLLPFRISGSGSPLFCFPGSGGNVHIFREMVEVLPNAQPIYGIDMEWLCEEVQLFTIEELGAFYFDVIRSVQKRGPYYFCGYSFGGLVAYEIATQLIDAGDSVGLIALLDTPNPALVSSLSATESAQFRKTYLMDRLKKYGVQLMRGDIEAFMKRGLAFIVSRGGRFFMPAIKTGYRLVNRALPETFRSNDPGFIRAWHSYIPKPHPLNLICFRVEDRGPEHDHDPSMGWAAGVTGDVQVYIVPGGHVDMMSRPSVGVIADKLANYLDIGSNHGEQQSLALSISNSK
jgi:thioesterase domain-containing protein